MRKHTSKDRDRLIIKQKEILSQIRKLKNFVTGSLVILKQTCGKKGCHCLKGEKHPGYYLSISIKGKSKICYVPRSEVTKIKRYSNNYKKLKKLLLRLTLVNIELLKHRGK